MNKSKLNDLVEIYNGSTPSTSKLEYFDGEIPWITPKDLSDKKTKYISSGERNITELGLASIGNRLLPEGTILFSSRAPIGLMSISSNIVSTNQGFKNLVCKEDKINNEYLYYLLKTKINEIQELGTGTTFKEVSKSTLGEFEFYYETDITIQQKIAKVLSDLDAKIELNNKINAELEAMAKTLYDYWFVQFDFPDKNGKPYKSSGGKMVWNEELKRVIPEGWEVKKLGEEIELFDSKRIPLSSRERAMRKGNIPYYGATGIMDYVDDYIFEGEYILMAEDGSVMDQNGFPIMQFIAGKTWVNNHAHVIRAKKFENNEFYFQLIKRIPVVLIKTGSIQMKINQENLKKHKVLIPASSLIEEYSKFAKTLRKKLINVITENQELASLRDWLLPMLMNGQVTVSSTSSATNDGSEVEDSALGMVAEEKESFGE